MNSKTDPEVVNRKERVFGHLIGPLGLIFVVNTIAALVEKFFTQQTGAMYGVENVEMVMKMGGRYEVVMTVAKILAVGVGIFMAGCYSIPKAGRAECVHGTLCSVSCQSSLAV